MAPDVYQKLAKHLDSLPGGYPPTKDGVELKILRKLFTPEQAALALHCTLIPEEARVIAGGRGSAWRRPRSAWRRWWMRG